MKFILSHVPFIFIRSTLASAGISCRRVSLSVRPSVCHKSVSYWNGST